MESDMPMATLADAVAAADDRLMTAAAGAGEALAAVETTRGDRYVLFSIASGRYAVLEAFVTELDRVPKITPVPRLPGWLRGVTNLRGDVLSVVDMRAFLGVDAVASAAERMLVVRLLQDDFATGLIVDSVERIVSVPPSAIRPPESALEGALAAYVTGMCVIDERTIAIVDLDRLLRSPEMRQFEEFEEGPDKD